MQQNIRPDRVVTFSMTLPINKTISTRRKNTDEKR
jgi:hypothetical protein